MYILQTFYEKYSLQIAKFLTVMFKLGLVVGATCLVSYSLKIGSFPRDLSLGDGLFFLTAAIGFGILSLFFYVCLFALGMMASPVIKGIFSIIVITNNKFRTKKLHQFHTFSPFTWWSPLISVYTVIMILQLGKQDPSAYWTIPLLSILTYIFYSIHQSSDLKIETISNGNVPSENRTNTATEQVERLRKIQLFCIVIIIFAPFLLGGIFGFLLNGVMRMMQVRVENATIYVMEPYASIISNPGLNTVSSQPSNYSKFENITVLLNGYGNYTVIELKDSFHGKSLEIPSEKIIFQR